MANISLTSNGYMDGSVAQDRNNDIIQLNAVRDKNPIREGDKVYTQVVRLDQVSMELLEEQTLQLKIMNKHLSILTGQHIPEDEVEGGE